MRHVRTVSSFLSVHLTAISGFNGSLVTADNSKPACFVPARRVFATTT